MISVIIPTYRREKVLVETITHVMRLSPAPGEIVVVDQTEEHDQETRGALSSWENEGRLRWIRLKNPSIPAAMNAGLLAARGEIVLFLDDDVIPCADLLDWHRRAHEQENPAGVVGQVLQPGESPESCGENEFKFCADRPAWIADAMAGNLSVRKTRAIEAGGFDENFRGAAYRFEKEFALRICGGRRAIFFEPRASIRHLRSPSGGTRSGGGHLNSVRPDHSVGGYYFELVAGDGIAGIHRRLFRSVLTRHHLRRPWWIPVTLVAELAGLAWALRLWLTGPKLLQPAND